MRSLAIAMTEPGHWLPWGRIHDAVRTGEPQTTSTLGTDLWTHLDRTPAEAADFNRGMAGMRAALGEESADIIDTRSAGLLVDVGGGNGSLVLVLDDEAPSRVVTIRDINMLVVTTGRERALGDFARLFERAGLSFVRATPTGTPLMVIEAVADKSR